MEPTKLEKLLKLATKVTSAYTWSSQTEIKSDLNKFFLDLVSVIEDLAAKNEQLTFEVENLKIDNQSYKDALNTFIEEHKL